MTNGKQQPRNILFTVLIAAGVALIIIGSFSSWHDIQANREANAQATKLLANANRNQKTKEPSSIQNSLVPSTIKPTSGQLTSYTTNPNYPRYLIIPKLGVNARVLAVGLNSQGALETPSNVFDTAWYDLSALPGQQGAMLIDGHISSWTSHGVFYRLNSLSPGDQVIVQTGNSISYTYDVIATKVYDANNVDMNAAVSSTDSSKPGLNLISCYGQVIAGTNDFNERIIVFTVLAS